MCKYFIHLFTVILLLLSCSNDSNISGTAESGNAKVAGIITDSSGNPEPNIIVYLLPSNYNPTTSSTVPDSLMDITDINGKYEISIYDTGDYNIYVNDKSVNRGILIRNLNLLPNLHINRIDTLKNTESLVIAAPSNSEVDSGFIYISGTLEYVKVYNGINSLQFSSLPLGFLPPMLFIEDAGNSNTTTIIEDNEIEIIADNKTVIGTFAEWSYSKNIKINTTNSGSNTASDLYNFPILLKLSNSNFDFSKTNSNGSDLRFTRSDTTVLNYEIESWNSTGQEAVIWVKVDTIFGNNQSQAIKMLWGNSSASSSSSSEAVFDTSLGYAAVWHFTPTDTFNDATSNSNNGTNFGASQQTSMIGKSIALDGGVDSNYIELTPNESLRPETSITLQAWINPDSINVSQLEGFFSYTNDDTSTESGFSFAYAFGNWKFLVITEDMTQNDINDNPGATVPLDTWSLLTGTYDGSTIKVYLNGELVASENKTGKIDWDPLPNYCRIGMYKDENETFEFNGGIDELRILNTASSDDWIKLCYENQKEGSSVITFE